MIITVRAEINENKTIEELRHKARKAQRHKGRSTPGFVIMRHARTPGYEWKFRLSS